MTLWLLFAAFLLALIVTEGVRRIAARFALIDVPVDRSLHTTPVPRGGGLGITVAVIVVTFAWMMSEPTPPELVPLLAASALAAALGFWDDKRGLTALFRLSVQFNLAILLLAGFLFYFPAESFDRIFGFILPIWISLPILAIAIVWVTNLYNFMDGSDGLAGSQSATVFLALTILSVFKGDPEAAAVCSIISAASVGFLFRNWQPAKIFMGDVGSIFLGFIAISSAIWVALRGEINFYAALCLHGCFIVDATITLITRMRNGKTPHQAHRSHTYQRWIQSGKSHQFIALAYSGVNLFWLLPVALIMTQTPSPLVQIVLLAIAWLPLAFFAIRMKAGHDFVASPAK